jgi:hypothetical protein
MTTPSHADLVQAAAKWLSKPYQNCSPVGHPGCSHVVTELVCNNMIEIPDVIGFHSHGSLLVEAKTSKADFHKDQNKPFRIYTEKGMGQLRYYICPTGLLVANEMPPYWGLLYFDGKSVEVEKDAGVFNDYYWQGEQRILLSSIRRLKEYVFLGI